jgi:branched-chain amino acid transport system ATP-binding protein
MLQVSDLRSQYGDIEVLHGISMHVDDGEIVALFGPNGHGKSTLLKSISGIHPATGGSVRFRDSEITAASPHSIVELGLAYIPEERHLFREMTVQENLQLGAYKLHDRSKYRANLEFVYEIFPRLQERKKQLCSTLSGGESRMVAIARGLMSGAAMLMVDEPSIGLAPGLKKSVFAAIERISQEAGITILIVEQELEHALEMAQRVYMLKKGRILFEESAGTVNVSRIREAYF